MHKDTTGSPDKVVSPDQRTWGMLLAAWSIALLSTASVLYIGEVMGQAPCNLCWFQRAFMFPLTVVLAVTCYFSDAGGWRYALPLAALGGIVAGYHSLLYLGLLPQAIEPCGAGPSCSGADMRILGGLPIPVLSLAAFSAIAGLLIQIRRRTGP